MCLGDLRMTLRRSAALLLFLFLAFATMIIGIGCGGRHSSSAGNNGNGTSSTPGTPPPGTTSGGSTTGSGATTTGGSGGTTTSGGTGAASGASSTGGSGTTTGNTGGGTTTGGSGGTGTTTGGTTGGTSGGGTGSAAAPRFLLVPAGGDFSNTGTLRYDIDPRTGMLSGPTKLDAGFAVFHTALHPSQNFVYYEEGRTGRPPVPGQQTLVRGYTVDGSGQLTAIGGSHPPIGALLMHPSGKFLYVAAEGVRGYTIDQNTGELSVNPVADTQEKVITTFFAVSPNGNVIIRGATNGDGTGTSQIDVYKVNLATGALAETQMLPLSTMPLASVITANGHFLISALNDGPASFSINEDAGTITRVATPAIGRSTPMVAHPSKPWIYAIDDKCACGQSFLRAFEVNQDGSVTEITDVVNQSVTPFGMVFDATSTYLYGNGVTPDEREHIVGFSVNQQTGGLSPIPGSPYDIGQPHSGEFVVLNK